MRFCFRAVAPAVLLVSLEADEDEEEDVERAREKWVWLWLGLWTWLWGCGWLRRIVSWDVRELERWLGVALGSGLGLGPGPGPEIGLLPLVDGLDLDRLNVPGLVDGRRAVRPPDGRRSGR